MPDKEALTTNYRHHTDSQPAWATRAVEQGGMSRLNCKVWNLSPTLEALNLLTPSPQKKIVRNAYRKKFRC